MKYNLVTSTFGRLGWDTLGGHGKTLADERSKPFEVELERARKRVDENKRARKEIVLLKNMEKAAREASHAAAAVVADQETPDVHADTKKRRWDKFEQSWKKWTVSEID